MQHRDVIYLISTRIVEDEIGNQVQQETARMVYANQMTVSQVEYYSAAAVGLRPSKMFEIYAFEYQGESKLKHDGISYQIIRAEGRGDKLRIICEKVIGNG